MQNNHLVKLLSIDGIVFIILTLFVGKGSTLTVLDVYSHPLSVFFYCVIIAYMLLHKTQIAIYNKALSLIFILAIWSVIHILFLDKTSSLYYYLPLILHSLAGLGIVLHYGRNSISYYAKSMYFLCIVSFIGYGIQTFGGTAILQSLPFVVDCPSGNSEHSLILYTINEATISDLYLGFRRNSGCAWEPGLFSVMIGLAVTFKIINENGKIKLIDKEMIVFLFAMLTTMSTTGYILVFLVILFNLLFTSKISTIRKSILSAGLLALSVWIYSMPFISGKIDEKSDSSNYFTESGAYLDRKAQFTVDRFEGMALDMMNVKDKPLLGYGLDRENSYVYNSISPLILTSNGLAKPLAQYGVFLFAIYKGTKKMVASNLSRLYILLIICLFVASVSYDLQLTPIIKAIQIMGLIKFTETKIAIERI